MRNRDFLRVAVLFFFGAGLVGLGLGFYRYVETGYWFFPLWPNIGDCIFACLGGFIILYYALTDFRRSIK